MLDWMQDACVAVRRRCKDRNSVALQPARITLPHLQRGAHPTPCIARWLHGLCCPQNFRIRVIGVIKGLQAAEVRTVNC